jgi:site-specific recombinase XerD
MQLVEPEISSLEADNGALLDEVTILSNEAEMRRATNVVGIHEVTPLKHAAAPQKATPEGPPPQSKRKKRSKAAPSHLQELEIERLFKVITGARDRAIFRLAYHAGLRASEVGMLELRDYQPRTERMFIHRLKGSNSGEHHLCREEAKALRAWLKVRGNDPGPIFTSRKRRAISRKMLDVLMKQYGAIAALPEKLRHFHVLKHSCATHLLSKGFHVEQVQDWIGHANIQNTMIYAHVTNSRREEMGKALRDSWR